jgi:molybdopterin-guanine dinucleotide biosynthesis protein A
MPPSLHSNGNMRSFSAAVMAGGHSTRMGTDKAFLRVGHEVLIERQLRCLREAGAAELLISGREGVDYSSFGTKVVFDEKADCGPLAGLAAVLASASSECLLVLAVDMPAMRASMLKKIISQCKQDAGCVPRDEDGFQPLAAAYPKSLLPLARRQLEEARYSMHKFVVKALEEEFVSALDIEPSDQKYFANWNQPADWPQSP